MLKQSIHTYIKIFFNDVLFLMKFASTNRLKHVMIIHCVVYYTIARFESLIIHISCTCDDCNHCKQSLI